MGKVETVRGQIDTAQMGKTLIHEHLIATDWNLRMNIPNWLDEEKITDDIAARSLLLKKEYGINTIGDPTPWSLGRDVKLLQKIAKKADVHVLCATGFYADRQPYFRGVSEKTLVEYMVSEIQNGIQGTGIKPAMIKCATDERGVDAQNEKLLTAAAKAHLETGVPIFTHSCPANRSGLKQQDIFEREGVDLHNVVIGHCGDTSDVGYIEKICQKGSYVGLDRFGQDKYNPLVDRIDTTVELFKRGWGKQILLSHDCIVYYNDDRYDVKPKEDIERAVVDLRYIDRFVIPELLKRGITQREIRQMLIENPAAVWK